VLGDVELLAGELVSAERLLRQLCETLEQMRDFGHLASRAGDLAEALFRLERYDEAHDWTRLAESCAAEDDLDAQTVWRSVRAKIHARQGAVEIAVETANEAARLIGPSDGLNRRARVTFDLAEVLFVAGRRREAADAAAEARDLYLQKGNLVAAGRVQELLREPASA
jgi:tetratricopeptide (TPR) repeat protein